MLRRAHFCIAAVLLMLCLPVAAEPLTIERFVASPSLSGPAIKGLKLSPDGTLATYLKGKPDNHKQQDLWAYHIATDQHRLLVDSVQLTGGDEQLSEVERARRERQRIKGSGIVEYYWSPNSDGLLFPIGGDLYYLGLEAAGQKPTPRRLTNNPAFETDVRFSPKGNFVSFVREQNLYVIDLAKGREIAITKKGAGAISYATAEFVAQEEMGRNTGYWWAADESRIALTRIDESQVTLMDRYEVATDGSVTAIQQRYPFAGEVNARLQLGVVKVGRRTPKIRWMDLGDNQDIYLARVNWLPDSKTLAIQRLNRSQSKNHLLFADSATGKSWRVLTEASPYWINLHDDLKFLKDSQQFVWASERSGYKHLYLLDYQGKVIRQLTSGDWVVDHLVSVDEKRRQIYFMANADGVLERHFYRVPLDGGDVHRLTKEPGWHSVDYGCIRKDGDCQKPLFIDNFSADGRPPAVALKDEKGGLITWLEENPLDDNHPYSPYLTDHVPLEYGTLNAEDGKTLHYQLMKPKKLEPGKRYPAIVFLYGGPHSQLVKNAWNTRWFNQFLARNGYVVITIDNRGTYNRGAEFEGVIKGRLGEAEVTDQLAAVKLLKTLPYVDEQRLGVYGWSYGGYMSLMSLFKAPDTFAAAVSVAPVTDWLLYDTCYTERYMGVPEKPEDYQQASVFPYIDNYVASDKRGDLLLIHGMADDNVFFDNAVKLMGQLQEKRVDFQLMTYPGKRHGIRGEDAQAHLWQMVFRFFEGKLK
ncbi:S9 family peptidase [Porticoccus sp. W117]|uniref:S9 family peptidase n=1 Tax=Porticoccus sp. W117 TaxID=3054777 RepID=UPI00259AC51D|nr:S9 family peptidase [Porticoccus sp. W117]MDM3869877.1 S9 family peptidase [Porticoccus sp. W117]